MIETIQRATSLIYDALTTNAAGLLAVLLFVLFVRYAASRLGRN